MPSQPTLTDGVVTLRAWREDDVEQAVVGHDEEITFWFGQSEPPTVDALRAEVERWQSEWDDGRRRAVFLIEHDGAPAGVAELRAVDEHTGELWWWLYAGHRGRGLATRAIRTLIDWALTEPGQGGLGLSRVQARIEPENQRSMRVATRSGMRREGTQRVVAGTGDRRDTTEYAILARLRDDPPLSDPVSFRSLLNSFLPRKRGIGQMLVRDGEGRVLLCHLTYKSDWDLPGGVVEVGESPQLAVSRELEEELGLRIDAGPLVVTDWLPPWGGWDDALCLVFDGGVHPDIDTEALTLQAREIKGAAFLTPEEIDERCADFTARRIRAALAGLDGGPRYTESGRATSR